MIENDILTYKFTVAFTVKHFLKHLKSFVEAMSVFARGALHDGSTLTNARIVLRCRLLGNRASHKDPEDSWKHCLIMDEVDGMAGNEDRGGIQVLQLQVIFVLFIAIRSALA